MTSWADEIRTMRCFQVAVNDEVLCTAGVAEGGILTAIISLAGKRDEQCEDPNQKGSRRAADLHVGGLANNIHLGWLNDSLYKLRIGDRVIIRIIEAESADLPIREEPSQELVEERNAMMSAFEKCAFCGYAESEERTLVPGPAVSICSKCVERCAEKLQAAERYSSD